MRLLSMKITVNPTIVVLKIPKMENYKNKVLIHHFVKLTSQEQIYYKQN